MDVQLEDLVSGGLSPSGCPDVQGESQVGCPHVDVRMSKERTWSQVSCHSCGSWDQDYGQKARGGGGEEEWLQCFLQHFVRGDSREVGGCLWGSQ